MLRLWFRRAKLDTPTEYESFIKMMPKVRTTDNRKNSVRDP
jgi:hypothetical protein